MNLIEIIIGADGMIRFRSNTAVSSFTTASPEVSTYTSMSATQIIKRGAVSIHFWS